MPEPHQDELCREALHRSRLYKLLALGFRYPDGDLHDVLADGGFSAALEASFGSVRRLRRLRKQAARLEKDAREAADRALTDLEVAYNSTFVTGAPSPPCPPYEGLCRNDLERTGLMIEIASFYRHFGLDITSAEGKRDLPDHLCAELEFMHFLTFKEAQARADGDQELTEGYLAAQRDFVARHPSRWFGELAAGIARAKGLRFYARLAAIAAGLAGRDLEWLSAVCPDVSAPAEEFPAPLAVEMA